MFLYLINRSNTQNLVLTVPDNNLRLLRPSQRLAGFAALQGDGGCGHPFVQVVLIVYTLLFLFI